MAPTAAVLAGVECWGSLPVSSGLWFCAFPGRPPAFPQPVLPVVPTEWSAGVWNCACREFLQNLPKDFHFSRQSL